MQNLTVAEGSTKFALLCEWVKRQGSVDDVASRAGVTNRDFTRRARELRASGLIEPVGTSGRFRVTSEGRSVCRELKSRLR